MQLVKSRKKKLVKVSNECIRKICICMYKNLQTMIDELVKYKTRQFVILKSTQNRFTHNLCLYHLIKVKGKIRKHRRFTSLRLCKCSSSLLTHYRENYEILFLKKNKQKENKINKKVSCEARSKCSLLRQVFAVRR